MHIGRWVFVLYSIVTSKVWNLMLESMWGWQLSSNSLSCHIDFCNVLTNHYMTRGDNLSLTTTLQHLVHPCGFVPLSMHVQMINKSYQNSLLTLHRQRMHPCMFTHSKTWSHCIHSCSPIGRNKEIYMPMDTSCNHSS